MEPLTLAGVAGGVLTHFVYDGLKETATAAIKELAPGAFRGSAVLLREIDREFEDIKQTILKRYARLKTVEIFLSPERTIRRGVLKPLFDYLFLGAPLDRQALIASFIDCLAKGEMVTGGRIGNVSFKKIVDDIIDTSKRVYLSNVRTAPFVINAAVAEIHNSFRSIEQINRHLEQEYSVLVRDKEDQLITFCEDYITYIKTYVREIVINGLDAVTKKEN